MATISSSVDHTAECSASVADRFSGEGDWKWAMVSDDDAAGGVRRVDAEVVLEPDEHENDDEDDDGHMDGEGASGLLGALRRRGAKAEAVAVWEGVDDVLSSN